MNQEEIQTKGLALAETIKTDLKSMLDNQCGAPDCSISDKPGSCRANGRLWNAVKNEEINCFGDLHDIMNANMLGDSAECWSKIIEAKVYSPSYDDAIGRGDMTEEEAIVQTACDVVNVAQDEVNHWIKKGGLREP